MSLARKVGLTRDVAAGEIVRWSDVAIPDTEAVRARHDMEQSSAAAASAIAAQ
jgi:hypothetical protein